MSYVYVAPVYDPPNTAAVIGAILRAPRKIRHTGNFSHVFSPVREEQLEYVDGLMVVMSIFIIAWVIWAFTLLVLKFKGKDVGCASGRAFVTVRSDDEDDGYFDKPTEDDIGSTSSSSGEISDNNRPLFSDGQNNRPIIRETKDGQDEINLAVTMTDPMEDSGGRSHSSGWITTSFSDDGAEGLREPSNTFQSSPVKINPRENRTRACFIFFALLALLCVPLILVFSYAPMREATESSDQLVLDIRDTINQVEASLNSIESASMSALEIVNSTPTDLAVVCPMISAEAFELELGVDLTNIINSIANEYNRLKAQVKSQLAMGNNLVDRIESGVTQFEGTIDTTEEYMWAVPALLFGVSILCAISILGVVMAWREQSGMRFQRTMSYVVLPLLVLASIACWIVVVLASTGSMVGTDMCISSSKAGSPDQTIQEILSLYNLEANSTAYQLISAYTNQCIGPDPTQQISDLEQQVQDHIDSIWRQMSQIDSLGRAQVIAKCGAEGTFSDMLSGARNLAKLLTAIRRSLSSTERSLKCNMINPIYAEAAHVTICTSALKSTVNGFILFLVLSICIMVMISLRASWLRHIEEEKVYHDEDEVAENMILDEHEEYLAYISKYKHEWQEYEGFEEDGADHDYEEEESYYDDEEDDGNGCEGFDEASGVSGIESGSANFSHDPPTTSYGYDNTVDGATYISDEVSFLSLSVKKSEEDSHNQVFPEELLAPPAALLQLPPPPPPMNPNHFSPDTSHVHSARVAAIPLHHVPTAPAPQQNALGRAASMPRKAFYGTSARRSHSRSFAAKGHPRVPDDESDINFIRSSAIDPPPSSRLFSFENTTQDADNDEGIEVMMR